MIRKVWMVWALALACGDQKSRQDSADGGAGTSDVSDDTAADVPDDTAADSGTPGPGPETECDTGAPEVTWTNWGEGFFRSFCTACHSISSPNRYDAPETINFDTLVDVRGYEAAIRSAVLDRGTMPVGGGAPEEDLYLLGLFLDCGLQP